MLLVKLQQAQPVKGRRVALPEDIQIAILYGCPSPTYKSKKAKGAADFVVSPCRRKA